jgi:2,4-dienoyl-CoA reductase-like NADH-dependent reductase (Old Yellow Enzyme family)
MPAMCPSAVPVALPGADSMLNKWAMGKVLGTPKAMTVEEIDEVVDMFRHGARVAHAAGFDGIQLHGAHGFLLSQFLSPRTNRRTDAYGGSPEKRMGLLKRLVTEIREEFPPPFCISVKLNSADYMTDGQGLQASEGLEQVRWLILCGMVDMIEISGGNAENTTSKLHNSFGAKTMDRAPERKATTRIREAFFSDFADEVQKLQVAGSKGYVPIQLSGGYRSRVGMADGIESGVTDLIGLGRSAVLEPTLPRKTLLNPAVPDTEAIAMSHVVRGQWFANAIPIKVVGSGLGIQFFYHNMRRLGRGLASDPDLSIPMMLVKDIIETLRSGLATTLGRIIQSYRPAQKLD